MNKPHIVGCGALVFGGTHRKIMAAKIERAVTHITHFLRGFVNLSDIPTTTMSIFFAY